MRFCIYSPSLLIPSNYVNLRRQTAEVAPMVARWKKLACSKILPPRPSLFQSVQLQGIVPQHHPSQIEGASPRDFAVVHHAGQCDR